MCHIRFVEKCFCSKDDGTDLKYLVLKYVKRYCSTVVEMISSVPQNLNERVSVSYLTFSVPCEGTTENKLYVRTKLFPDVFQHARTP